MRKLFVILTLGGLMTAAFLAGNYFRSGTPADTAANWTKVAYNKSMLDPNKVTAGSESPVVVDCGSGRVTIIPTASSGPQASRIIVDCNDDPYSYTSAASNRSVARNVVDVRDDDYVPAVERRVARRTVRPVVGQQVVERRIIERERPLPRRYYRPKRRSWEREVLIVAGSAGAGTAIGALAGGKKGAGVGALSGGVAGLVYDLATRNRSHPDRYSFDE